MKKSIEMVQDRIKLKENQMKVWSDMLHRNPEDYDSKLIKIGIQIEIEWLNLLLIQIKDEK